MHCCYNSQCRTVAVVVVAAHTILPTPISSLKLKVKQSFKYYELNLSPVTFSDLRREANFFTKNLLITFGNGRLYFLGSGPLVWLSNHLKTFEIE